MEPFVRRELVRSVCRSDRAPRHASHARRVSERSYGRPAPVLVKAGGAETSPTPVDMRELFGGMSTAPAFLTIRGVWPQSAISGQSRGRDEPEAAICRWDSSGTDRC
jgi:hypothetical protein